MFPKWQPLWYGLHVLKCGNLYAHHGITWEHSTLEIMIPGYKELSRSHVSAAFIWNLHCYWLKDFFDKKWQPLFRPQFYQELNPQLNSFFFQNINHVLISFPITAIFLYETALVELIFIQHSGYWWPGAKAPGHQLLHHLSAHPCISICLWVTQCHMQYSTDINSQICNISHTLVGNKIVDHSDVGGASSVDAAPTTSSFSTYHLASMDCAKTTTRWDEKHLSFGIGCSLYYRFDSIENFS